MARRSSPFRVELADERIRWFKRGFFRRWKQLAELPVAEIRRIDVEVVDALTYDSVFLAFTGSERTIRVEEDDEGFDALAAWMDGQYELLDPDWRETVDAYICANPLKGMCATLWLAAGTEV